MRMSDILVIVYGALLAAQTRCSARTDQNGAKSAARARAGGCTFALFSGVKFVI